MDNSAIADNFSLLSKIMDIHGENSFKTRTYSIAAYNIENLPMALSTVSREEITNIKGMSGSVGAKVVEMLDTGELSVLHEYIMKTPPGVIEMLQIKGIGPKKIHTIWKEMEIESVGELLYACNENRLTRYKGFGEKTQKNVQDAIEFFLLNQGSFLFAQLEELFPQVNGYLEKLFLKENIAVTGAYRRQALTIDELEFIVLKDTELIKPFFQTAQPPELLEESTSTLLYKLKNGLKLRLYTGEGSMAIKQFTQTGSSEFLDAFKNAYPGYEQKQYKSEEEIFTEAGLPFIPPYLREKPDIIETARRNDLPVAIQTTDIRSIIHSHSDWSDGSETIAKMAEECIRLGHEYLVISDHSKAAAYARGLTEDRIQAQHQYVDELNRQYAPFRIFKSIECDILNDGSLDYSPEILQSFDLVIASIHSNLKMPEEKAMMRLIKAITNPFTTILGHMTGRLLLSRRGYPVDHKTIIEACAAHQVAIEINAHPRRLDIDWSWIDYALEKNVLLSINPDAHSLEGFSDIRYGVLAAQKGGLPASSNLSSFTLAEFERFLASRRISRGI